MADWIGKAAEMVGGVMVALRRGATQIKIMASGGVASPTDPIGAYGYSEDEIRAIVAEAKARHTYVLAHAYTAEAIERAVRCGVAWCVSAWKSACSYASYLTGSASNTSYVAAPRSTDMGCSGACSWSA